ncbi:hypothetical protein XENOCAPTIV_014871, partial [Xenoophorus captivus]
VLGRCFVTVMQVHFQFLSQALQKVQPVAQNCLAEALAQAQERCVNSRSQSSDLGPLTELEEASRSWKGAAEATARLRERGRDGCLAGLQVQQLFCSNSTTIPEHQLKELNMKIDSALQHTMLQLIKELLGQNGMTPRDESPVTEVLNQVCPSSWRGACKTAVQLLFAQAGLIENKEAYAPHITLEGSKVVVQVPSTWWVSRQIFLRELITFCYFWL